VSVWRRSEPALDRETVDGIIRKLMSIDRKLELVIDALDIREDDGEEEVDT
jgi:hypothetical protein